MLATGLSPPRPQAQKDSSILTKNNNGNDSRVHVNEMTSLQQQDSSDSTQNNNGDDSRAHVTIEMTSHQQEDSSGSTQNINGNGRCLMSPDVGAQEKHVPITALLEMGARILGVLVCGLPVAVLVQGGMVTTVETEDRVFVTVVFLSMFPLLGLLLPPSHLVFNRGYSALVGGQLEYRKRYPPIGAPHSFHHQILLLVQARVGHDLCCSLYNALSLTGF